MCCRDQVTHSYYKHALAALAEGKIVAYPTETFYGLAVDPYNEQAMEVLYALKKRDPKKPVSLVVADTTQLEKLISHCSPVYTALMQAFWPGPLTLVFFPVKAAALKLCSTMGQDSLAIRISSHPVARELCRLWGGPLTATSANISNFQPLSSAGDVYDLWGKQIGAMLDDGITDGGKGSTIVSYLESARELHILRQGAIATEAIIKRIAVCDIVCKS